MKQLELNQMENLQGGDLNPNACLFAVGIGLAAIPVMGPWGLVIGMTLACGSGQAH